MEVHVRPRVPALRLASLWACLVGLAQSAEGLSLTLEGVGVGPISSGIGSGYFATDLEPPEEQLTFIVGLDEPTAINGYDITLAWDPSELSFSYALSVLAFPFAAAPDGSQSSGTRVASIRLTSFTASALFSVTFEPIALTGDGQADVWFFVDEDLNGSGLSPGSLSLANPAGAGIDVVPEPDTAALFTLGLALLSAARARAKRTRL